MLCVSTIQDRPKYVGLQSPTGSRSLLIFDTRSFSRPTVIKNLTITAYRKQHKSSSHFHTPVVLRLILILPTQARLCQQNKLFT